MSSSRKLLLSLNLIAITIASLTTMPVTMATAATAEDTKQSLTFEEILERRKSVRQELMLPSLEGIRGIAYRVVGYKDFEPLEKAMGKKLADLNMPIVRFVEMKEGQKPVDAIVQITFFKMAEYNMAELTVTQWVSLLRDPKKKVRAVTYKDRYVLPHGKPLDAVNNLTGQFVIDTLQANQKKSTADDTKKETAPPKTKSKSKKK